jgi:MFS family permease
MSDVLIEPEGTHEPHLPKTPRKAALAAWIGSALEYYDFFIYGTAAALFFGDIFFAGSSAGTFLAFATFGVGYVARPLGAFVLGHIGDRFGRKKVLIFTLLLMGGATFLVGCLPTYEQIGPWAPALLVGLRLLQGFSAGGEQSGANSMTLEHAPAHRRGFYSSFTLSGTQAGLILATAVFLPISTLSDEVQLAWGWRIPFLLSAFVVVVGLIIRRTLEETPAFKEEEQEGVVPTVPVAFLFRHYSVDVTRVIFAAFVSVISTIFGLFTLSYAVNDVGLPRTTMLTVLILANFVALAAIPLWAALSDRVGRKPIFIIGALGSALLTFPYFWAISRENIALIFVFGILLSGVVYSAANGVWPATYGEQFETRVRLSGMAIGTQIGFALGGFAPAISEAILGEGPNGWVPVAIFTVTAAVISAISVSTMRETHKVHMHELGRKEILPALPA